MISRLFIVLLSGLGLSSQAQQDAWVYFSDKPDAAFYLSNPLEMLSQRALDRRAAQGITLDELDVPVAAAYIEGISQPGITVMAVSKWLNAAHVRGEVAEITALSSLSFVSSVDFADNSLDGPDQRLSAPRPDFRQQNVQADFPYGGSSNQIQMLNGHLLHQQDFTGSGLQIAVIDNGFPGVDTAPPFSRLHENGLILGGYDFVHDSPDFYMGGSHGTVVLSTMGGYQENSLVGTAPDASYYLFVSEDTAQENPVEESWWAEAAEMADSLGVDIISSSLGYRPFDNPNYNYSYQDMDGQTTFISRAAEIAFSRGMIVVVSAGNSGNSSDPHIWAPSDAAHVLSIGAVDESENYAAFSSTGPSADGRIKPDVVARGVMATVSGVDGTIYGLSGTSFSAPITAGMIACLWQALPGFSNQEIIDLVKQSSDQYSNPDAFKGYGVPDFYMALQTALEVPESETNPVRLFPNPVGQDFRFSIVNGTMALLLIRNMQGQIVLKQTISSDRVEASALPSGIYQYELESNTGRSVGKFIKL